jgi:predicted transcriptional regulator
MKVRYSVTIFEDDDNVFKTAEGVCNTESEFLDAIHNLQGAIRIAFQAKVQEDIQAKQEAEEKAKGTAKMTDVTVVTD